MTNTSIQSLYLPQGNIQFSGKIKIGQIQLTNEQFFELLFDNVSWKRYISYQLGQVCSKKLQNSTAFFYSLSNNNLANDPLNSVGFWQPVVFENQICNDLIFKIPKIQSQDNIKLQIQFSQSNTFSEVLRITSDDEFSTAIFYISSAETNQIEVLNGVKINSNYSNQMLIFKKTQIHKYFRYRWISDLYGQSKYYFGVSNAQLQTFSSDSITSTPIHVDNVNIVGDGSQSKPLMLNQKITAVQITGVESNITISASDNGGDVILNGNNIIFNGHNINTAEGIVVLNKNGKIEQSLYVDGDFNNRLLPIKKNITELQLGNPLVVYKTANQYTVQNDSATILLIQGATLNNQAIGTVDSIVYENHITQQETQYFKGGYVIGVKKIDQQGNTIINNILQIAIQLKNSELSNFYYKSVYQHLNSHEQLCYLGVNKNGFVFGLQDKLSNVVDFARFGNCESYKFVIQYCYDEVYFNHYAIVYCNGIQCLIYDFDNHPFLVENSQGYIYIYFGEQVSNVSNSATINGINSWWRLLKVDKIIKDNQINKAIGQLYYSEATLNYANIKVDYNWSQSSNTQDAVVFGKKDGIPYIFPYPQLEHVLPTASKTTKGGVIIGNGLYVDEQGVISVNNYNTNCIDLGSYVHQGNINIRSAACSDSSVTIQSGNLEVYGIGGTLFLGSSNSKQKYSSLSWNNITQVNLGQFQTVINYQQSKIILSEGKINIVADSLYFNSNPVNDKNGLVLLDDTGHINSDLLRLNDSGKVVEPLTIYNENFEQLAQCTGIVAGNGVTIEIKKVIINDEQKNIAIINLNEDGQLRQDQIVNYTKLVDNKYIVKNVNLGGFVIQDDLGYMIYPVQKQITYNNNNAVQIDFTQFIGEHGLRETQDGQLDIQYKIRFVRGYRGVDGQLTKKQATNLIWQYLI